MPFAEQLARDGGGNRRLFPVAPVGAVVSADGKRIVACGRAADEVDRIEQIGHDVYHRISSLWRAVHIQIATVGSRRRETP